MNQPDLVSLQLDVIARLLETCGYAIDVDYQSASIIVWCENWPAIVQVKRQPMSDLTEQGETNHDSLCD